MGAEKRINGCGEEKLYFGATVLSTTLSPPQTPNLLFMPTRSPQMNRAAHYSSALISHNEEI